MSLESLQRQMVLILREYVPNLRIQGQSVPTVVKLINYTGCIIAKELQNRRNVAIKNKKKTDLKFNQIIKEKQEVIKKIILEINQHILNH